eukprot:3926203-Amphidinium_carterae.2
MSLQGATGLQQCSCARVHPRSSQTLQVAPMAHGTSEYSPRVALQLCWDKAPERTQSRPVEEVTTWHRVHKCPRLQKHPINIIAKGMCIGCLKAVCGQCSRLLARNVYPTLRRKVQVRRNTN